MLWSRLKRSFTPGHWHAWIGRRLFVRSAAEAAQPASALQYRPELDGLRAIAVLAVVGFHAFPEYVPGGFVGVDVFFVLSGYLITTIILRQLAQSRFTFKGFYVRRARRILPALLVILLTSLLFGAWALLPEEFASLGKQAAAAAGFVANLTFWRESGYFAPAAELEPLLHLWSLGIEEQFYLVWPILLLWAWRRELNIGRLTLVLSLASFLLSVLLVGRDPPSSFYLPFCRFWELGLGCLLASREVPARLQSKFQASRAHMRTVGASLPWAGAAMIGVSIFAFNSRTAFPGVAALLPTIGAVCVVAGPRTSWFSARILSQRALVFIGVISYSLYLWHWPVLSFMAILNSGTPPAYARLGGVLLSGALAVITFWTIESPLRSRTSFRGLRVSRTLVGATAVVGVLGLLVFAMQGMPQRFPKAVTAIEQGPKTDSLCQSSVPRGREFNYCRRTTPAAPDVVFLGDSQAQAVYEGAVSVLGAGKPMLLLGRGGCPPGLDVPQSPEVYASDERRDTCNATWDSFVDYVRDMRPDVVVLVGDGARFFFQYPSAPDASLAENTRAFESGLSELVDALQRYSRVIYLLEIPTFPSSPTCLLRPVQLPGSTCSPQLSRQALVRSRSQYREGVASVQRQHPALLVVDSVPSLCGTTKCSQFGRGGQILYSDKMHLSPAGGRRLAEHSGLSKSIADQSGPAHE